MRPSSRRVFYALALAILLCSINLPVWSQSTASGTITGQITDPQNAVVTGATIRVTDATTNSSMTGTTNEAGRFSIINVPPATYVVTITKPGFSVRRMEGQQVQIGTLLTINATLELGSTSTIVEVTSAAGAELQTSNASVGSSISGAALLTLPNIGRDASTLAIYQPGVSPEGSVAGAIYDQNTFQLDGGNNTNDMDGSMNIYTSSYASNGAPTGVMPTPVESIEEFKVSTSGQTADFNNSSGSQVQMVTKRGTNSIHGSAYEFYYASNVGAANYFDKNHIPSGSLGYTPLPVTHRNTFGVAAGGPIAPKFLGGRTYAFFNYQGFRFPQSAIITRNTPTALMRAGVIQVRDANGNQVPYNLNPNPVTVNGTTYQPAICPAGPCDPRGIGLNAIVSKLWSQYMPLPNVASGGDKFNTQGFQGTVALPNTSNFFVGRVDHDFGEKWRFMTSFRQYHLINLTTNQLDIGGFFGGSIGHPTAQGPRPQVPDYWVAGLTTNITPTLTNDFRFSYLRNFWQWGTNSAVPQFSNLGGALEIGGEITNALIPYNVNTQSTRQRFWDGHDTSFRDDLTMIKGNHLFQFGGNYERNYDYHQRTDNGGGIMNKPVMQIAYGPGIAFPTSYIPATVPSSQVSTYRTLYTEVLGIVSQSQNPVYAQRTATDAKTPLGLPCLTRAPSRITTCTSAIHGA